MGSPTAAQRNRNGIRTRQACGIALTTALAAAAAHASGDRNTMDYLPLLDVAEVSRLSREVSGSPTGLYVRLYAESDLQAVPPEDGKGGVPASGNCLPHRRCYEQEKKKLFGKWMASSNVSRIFSVRTDIRNPTLSAINTLAAASYENSRSKGESWSTEVNGRLLLTPYFRLDSSTTGRIEFGLNTSSSTKDQVSGTAMAVMYQAALYMTPATPLLTSLNSGDVNKASDFISSTINALFSNSVSEKTVVDINPTALAGGHLATVDAYFPPGRDGIKGAVHIGTWKIMASQPLASIFNTNAPVKGACDKKCLVGSARDALEGVTPTYILNFAIAQNISLKDAIVADTAVSAARDGFKKLKVQAEPAGAGEAARALCIQIDQRAQALGLNQFDAAAVLWAYAQDGGFSSEQSRLLRSTDTGCAAALTAHELGLPAR